MQRRQASPGKEPPDFRMTLPRAAHPWRQKRGGNGFRKSIACLALVLGVLAAACGSPPVTETWDYVAMGVFTREAGGISTVPSQYAAHIEKDKGVTVALHNQERMEPEDIAENLQTNEELRQLVREAEVITFDFSLEWINFPEGLFRSGMCKGADNQDCLRTGVQEAKDDWSAIVSQITELRAGKPIVIRVLLMGDWWLDWRFAKGSPENDAVIGEYYRELESFLEADAARRGIPVVRAFPEPYFNESPPPSGYFGGIGGVHYSDEGSAVLAGLLRGLGYEPVVLK
ncbi:MAG: hypothetical protein V1755_02240 [Chloroflexota bacterium]